MIEPKSLKLGSFTGSMGYQPTNLCREVKVGWNNSSLYSITAPLYCKHMQMSCVFIGLNWLFVGPYRLGLAMNEYEPFFHSCPMFANQCLSAWPSSYLVHPARIHTTALLLLISCMLGCTPHMNTHNTHVHTHLSSARDQAKVKQYWITERTNT